MSFRTKIQNIPCYCEVLEYEPSQEAVVFGPGMGDAHPPEPPTFRYRLVNDRGTSLNWLKDLATERDENRLIAEYLSL